MIEQTSILYRNPDLLMNTVNGETVMMSIERGNYYGMNATGNLIWNFLENEKSVKELTSHLQTTFQINEETILTEVYPFLEKLIEEQIIAIK